MRAPLDLEDVREQARARVPPGVWAYIDGGSGRERTLTGNAAALERLMLRPRCLVDVSKRELCTSVLGHPVAMPIGIAPMAYHCLVDPDGEVATARAAAEHGVLFIASIFASRTLEEIAAVASGPLWLQIYWLRRRELLHELMRRAEDAGFQALVLTVDAPWIATRPREIRSGFALPAGVRAANLDLDTMRASHEAVAGSSPLARHAREQLDPSITWSDLAWLREQTRLPLVLKGILTAEDASMAIRCGADGIIVSNHGGRQLDGAVASMDALPEVIAAVAHRVQVLVDGGVRHGTDVVKALALGARMVLIGRPVLWGLASAGERGVAHVLATLRAELEEAMVLLGRPRLADIDADTLAAPCPRGSLSPRDMRASGQDAGGAGHAPTSSTSASGPECHASVGTSPGSDPR
jgi:4-hydroxymandelate oxidase